MSDVKLHCFQEVLHAALDTFDCGNLYFVENVTNQVYCFSATGQLYKESAMEGYGIVWGACAINTEMLDAIWRLPKEGEVALPFGPQTESLVWGL